MKLQAKLMLIIGGAAVAAALLILLLTGLRINSISAGFAERSRKSMGESMRREAYSAVFAEGAHLDSLFNGMFLRLNMLCLELNRRTGPLDAAQAALEENIGVQMRIMDYSEHALTSGSSADAVAYVQLLNQETGAIAFGVGRSSNTMKASIRGLFSAVNRLFYANEREKEGSDGKTL